MAVVVVVVGGVGVVVVFKSQDCVVASSVVQFQDDIEGDSSVDIAFVPENRIKCVGKNVNSNNVITFYELFACICLHSRKYIV